MKLFTKEILDRMPKFGSTDEKDAKDIPIVCKWFTPDGEWTWYVTEYDGNDTCFGMVHGLENELGYFSVREIESVRGGLGLPIERDMYYGFDHKLSEVM